MPARSERPAKRLRRLSTDSEDQEEEEEHDWVESRQKVASTVKASASKAAPGPNMSRARRIASGPQPISLATVSSLPSSSPFSHYSLHLTIKLPPIKLRQFAGMVLPRSSKAVASASRQEQSDSGGVVRGTRARNSKINYTVASETDEDDEEMEELVDDEEVKGESVEDDEEEEDEEMADENAAVEEDDDGDVEMEVPLPSPVIKISRVEKGRKPTAPMTTPVKGNGKIVEAKDAIDQSDDDELSELESELEEEEEGMQLGAEEDVEGEEEEIEVEEEEEEEELDSDETPADGSRASTPDLTKLTKRQRARLEEGGSGHLLALPDEVQVKKHLTAEEHAMRRAEMARRRKNLSEKRNEEEKMETINKLLKKQAPKTNSRRRELNGAQAGGAGVGGADAPSEADAPKPSPLFVRWVSGREGNRIGVPEEWMEGPVGEIFGGGSRVEVKVVASTMKKVGG